MWTPRSGRSGYSSQEESIPSVPSLDSSLASTAHSVFSLAKRAGVETAPLNRLEKHRRRRNGNRRASSAPPLRNGAAKRRRSRGSRRPIGLQSGRVKVGVRCRPPFRDEVLPNRRFQPVVRVVPREATAKKELAQVHVLSQPTQRQRVFFFDYGFGPRATQAEVYETLAQPVVQRALQGYNGTIFAYGQTGTGKTHTMGILETVSDENAGIVPRALADVFTFANQDPQRRIDITMSFLQIYRESIQDLLVLQSPSPQALPAGANSSLSIRESRDKGFYVEGLSEYVVRNYEEAEAIVNVGLQHRALAATALNTTSSRSHTILTVTIQQPPEALEVDSAVTVQGKVKSKLLLIDLAGSERVRIGGHLRVSSSKKERLHETKSINSSLSALGNVIAALASCDYVHIPYRNSKLTRLLQDSLGGTASTALVACVGPAQSCQQETLSTLLFASRCMQVSSTPVRNEEIDYADLCASLQARLASLEQSHQSQLHRQQLQYETVIARLREQSGGPVSQEKESLSPGLFTLDRWEALFKESLPNGPNKMQHMAEWTPEQLLRLVQHLFEALNAVGGEVYHSYRHGLETERRLRSELQEAMSRATVREEERQREMKGMSKWDPLPRKLPQDPFMVSAFEAWQRAERRHPLATIEAPSLEELFATVRSDASPGTEYPQVQNFANASRLVDYVDGLVVAASKWHAQIEHHHSHSLAGLGALKQELATEAAERHRREEEAVNFSHVLKYLLSTNNKLRQKLSDGVRSRRASRDEELLKKSTSPTELLEAIVARTQEVAQSYNVESSGDPASTQSFARLAVRKDPGTRILAHNAAVAEELAEAMGAQEDANSSKEDNSGLSLAHAIEMKSSATPRERLHARLERVRPPLAQQKPGSQSHQEDVSIDRESAAAPENFSMDLHTPASSSEPASDSSPESDNLGGPAASAFPGSKDSSFSGVELDRRARRHNEEQMDTGDSISVTDDSKPTFGFGDHLNGSPSMDGKERWNALDAETRKIMKKVENLNVEEIDLLPPSTRDAVLILRRQLGIAAEGDGKRQ